MITIKKKQISMVRKPIVIKGIWLSNKDYIINFS